MRRVARSIAELSAQGLRYLDEMLQALLDHLARNVDAFNQWGDQIFADLGNLLNERQLAHAGADARYYDDAVRRGDGTWHAFADDVDPPTRMPDAGSGGSGGVGGTNPDGTSRSTSDPNDPSTWAQPVIGRERFTSGTQRTVTFRGYDHSNDPRFGSLAEEVGARPDYPEQGMLEAQAILEAEAQDLLIIVDRKGGSDDFLITLVDDPNEVVRTIEIKTPLVESPYQTVEEQALGIAANISSRGSDDLILIDLHDLDFSEVQEMERIIISNIRNLDERTIFILR